MDENVTGIFCGPKSVNFQQIKINSLLASTPKTGSKGQRKQKTYTMSQHNHTETRTVNASDVLRRVWFSTNIRILAYVNKREVQMP